MPQLKEVSGDHIFTARIAAIAGGSTGEVALLVVPWNATVTGVKFVPDAAITANGTNFATGIVRNRGAAAAGATQPATRSWAATNSVAYVAEAMTLSATAADLNLAAGDVLTWQKTEAASGLALPAGEVQLSLKVR